MTRAEKVVPKPLTPLGALVSGLVYVTRGRELENYLFFLSCVLLGALVPSPRRKPKRPVPELVGNHVFLPFHAVIFFSTFYLHYFNSKNVSNWGEKEKASFK